MAKKPEFDVRIEEEPNGTFRATLYDIDGIAVKTRSGYKNPESARSSLSGWARNQRRKQQAASSIPEVRARAQAKEDEPAHIVKFRVECDRLLRLSTECEAKAAKMEHQVAVLRAQAKGYAGAADLLNDIVRASEGEELF